MPTPRDTAFPKIVVVSTPKTGNTWVRYLLARIYRLPMRDLPESLEQFDWNAPGPRWIGQQHFYPTPEILSGAADAGVVFVTTIRHPADVLVSLYHHVRRTGETSELSAEPGYMQGDEPGLGARAQAYVREGFFQMLHLSLVWMRTGVAHLVRYEDLLVKPTETLRRLCVEIAPTAPGAIRWAVAESEIGELRRSNPENANFFRKGGAGGWRETVPAAIRKIFETQSPYPEQFKELGYSLESQVAGEPARVRNPFRAQTRFEDGSVIAPVLKQIYFALPKEVAEGFPENASTGPESFFAWLNEPAHDAPAQAGHTLVVTELAYRIYRLRNDLEARWPDIFGEDRWSYLAWFIEAEMLDYGLAQPFGEAVFRYPESGDARVKVGFSLGKAQRFENGATVSFTLIHAFAGLTPSLQQIWTDPCWSGRGSFFDWLRGRSANDLHPDRAPSITNLGEHLYRLRADVRERFPDLYDRDRKDFDYWFRHHAAEEYELAAVLVAGKSRVVKPRRRGVFWPTVRRFLWEPRREADPNFHVL